MKKQGTVVKWDSDKAFGFIRSPDTPADIFFHRRDLLENRPPAIGQAVTFDEIHVGGKGPRALKVELGKKPHRIGRSPARGQGGRTACHARHRPTAQSPCT